MGAFVLNSALLGFGLAMDAFSVSMADGLSAPGMSRGWRLAIPAAFAGFQFLMPMTGWLCVRAVAETFEAFRQAVPVIALVLLCFIGGKMLVEDASDDEAPPLGIGTLLMQGVATSIDALSVGFTIAEYPCAAALCSCGIIAAVTFALCAAGLHIGRRFGNRLAGRASRLGGIILIAIGIKIFLTDLL